MSQSIEFFYDFSSPNAYFAAGLLPKLATRNSASLAYRPILLGGLFRLLGTADAPGMSNPEKAAHGLRDLERWSAKTGLPFKWPSRFPISTVTALRVALVLDGQALYPDYVARVYSAYWADDLDISSDEVLSKLLVELGADAESVLSQARSPEIKQRLKDATDDARRRGVFGVPSMIVKGELYFGKDRLDFVEDALRG